MAELEKNIRDQLKKLEKLIEENAEERVIKQQKAILDKLLEEYVKQI